jgi:hypothetical protein
MAIASLAFGSPSPIPTPPAAGKKLFLGADGKLKLVAPDGTVEIVGGGSSTKYDLSPPLTPKESDRWVDSSSLRAYEFVGGAWIEIVSS